MNYKFDHLDLLEVVNSSVNESNSSDSTTSSPSRELLLSQPLLNQTEFAAASFQPTSAEVGMKGFLQTGYELRTDSGSIEESAYSTLESLANSSHLTTVIPKIAINDAIGPAGSQQFALQYQAVVAIGGFCSGALIAPDVVLSARHCGVFAGDSVFVGPDSGNAEFTSTVASVELPAGNSFDLLDGGDVAILRLVTPVPGDIATPYRLTEETDSLIGEVFTLVGYGIHGVGSTGGTFQDGLRWAGQNIIDNYGAPEPGFFGENQFSADFDDGSDFANMIPGSDPTPLEFEAAPAQGDSGSPILVKQNDEYFIAGVLSGGTTPTGLYGDVSWWTGISIFKDEIENAGGVFGETVPDVPVEDDHADTISLDATTLSFAPLGQNFIARETGMIGFEDVLVERDVFRFVLSTEGRVIIDARAQSGGLDTQLDLYDADGFLVATNDNTQNASFANPLDSQIVVDDLAAGDYFVAVSDAQENTGNYRFAVRHNVPSVPIDEFGNSFATAFDLSLASSPDTTFVNSVIEAGADTDFLFFTANSTGNLVVRSKALNGDLNTVLRGYDSERQLVDSNNNFNGGLDSRVAMPVEAGQSYFLRLSSVGQTSGGYRLSLRIKDSGGTSGAGKSLNGLSNIRLSLDNNLVDHSAPMDMKNMAGWPDHANKSEMLAGNV